MKKKYPRTYHLPWSQGATDDDKTHTLASVERMFAGREVVVTEKLDGENTTIYSTGECHARSVDSVAHASRSHVTRKAREIANCGLPLSWRVLGENVYAKHSIFYDRLPDFFVVFGMATAEGAALAWDDVEEWSGLLGMPHAPVVWRGVWDARRIAALYPFRSAFSTSHVAEGYVVRVAGSFPMDEFNRHVAKFVRRGHVQADSVHWMHQTITPNERA